MITPLEALKQTHMFDSQEDVLSACKYYGISIRNQGILFNKNEFNLDKVLVGYFLVYYSIFTRFRKVR